VGIVKAKRLWGSYEDKKYPTSTKNEKRGDIMQSTLDKKNKHSQFEQRTPGYDKCIGRVVTSCRPKAKLVDQGKPKKCSKHCGRGEQVTVQQKDPYNRTRNSLVTTKLLKEKLKRKKKNLRYGTFFHAGRELSAELQSDIEWRRGP